MFYKIKDESLESIRGWLCSIKIARGDFEGAQLESVKDRGVKEHKQPSLSVREMNKYLIFCVLVLAIVKTNAWNIFQDDLVKIDEKVTDKRGEEIITDEIQETNEITNDVFQFPNNGNPGKSYITTKNNETFQKTNEQYLFQKFLQVRNAAQQFVML